METTIFNQTDPYVLLNHVQYGLKGLSGLYRQNITGEDDTPLSGDERYGMSCILHILSDIQEQAYDQIQEKDIKKSS